MMYKKILVPIDGSQNSDRAAKVAVELAKITGAKLTFIHIIEPPYKYTAITGEAPLTLSEALLEHMEKNADNLLAEHKKIYEDSGVAINTIREYGHVADIICSRANDDNYDLIVIGSRGLGTVKRYLLGSTSDRVSHHAKCSVLIVK